MSDPHMLSIVFFAGGLVAMISMPLLQKPLGWLILGTGLSIIAWALGRWPVLPAYPAIGLGARVFAPYLFGMGIAFVFVSVLLTVFKHRHVLRDQVPSRPATRHI